MLEQPPTPVIHGPSSDPGPPAIVAWLPFVAVAGLVTILAATGVLPRWSGLVHAVAPPPLDISFDLRLLVARAPSYGVFVSGLVASIAIRSLVLAALMEAFGDGRSLGRRFLAALRLYAIAAALLGIAAGLEFAGLASVYAWYAWAGVALTLVVALRLMPRAVRDGRAFTPVWVLAGLAALGAIAETGGGVAPVALIPVSAVLTVFVLRRMGRRRLGAPAALPAALVAAVLLATAPAASAPISSDTRLLLVGGVDTASGEGAMYRFQPFELGVGCDRVFYYSYLGPGRDAPAGEAACPLRFHAPYVKGDTQRPLEQLVDAFTRQVERIRSGTDGAPIAVITHSQGAVIAWTALASGAVDGVTHLVSLAGFPHTPVGYPRQGEDGEGRIGADVLRLLSAGSRALGHGTFSPDAPLARQILASAEGLERVFGRPLPEGIAAATVSSSFDVVVAPEGQGMSGVPGWSVDATHVEILEAPATYDALREVLRDGTAPRDTLVAKVLDAVIHSFMPPPAGA